MKMNVVRAFFGYLAFSTRSLDAANIPENSDSKCVDSGCVDSRCLVPEGDFLQSCTEPRMDFYPSIDPLVPGTCKLTTTCNTYYESMPPITTNYYLPMQTLFSDVRNRNGTLYEGDSVLGKAKKPQPLLDSEKLEPEGESPLDGPKLDWFQRWTKEDEEACQQPYGSYEDTCEEVTVKPYVPQDFELQESPFCIAETTCTTVAGKEKSSNTVYYKKAEERFENCNGIILVQSRDQKNNVCQGKTKEDIEKIVVSELYGKVSKPRT